MKSRRVRRSRPVRRWRKDVGYTESITKKNEREGKKERLGRRARNKLKWTKKKSEKSIYKYKYTHRVLMHNSDSPQNEIFVYIIYIYIGERSCGKELQLICCSVNIPWKFQACDASVKLSLILFSIMLNLARRELNIWVILRFKALCKITILIICWIWQMFRMLRLYRSIHDIVMVM